MTESGTEKRLDELSGRVDELSDRVDGVSGRVDELSRRVDDHLSETRRGFDRVDADIRELRLAIASLSGQMTRYFAGTLGTVVGGMIITVITSHS